MGENSLPEEKLPYSKLFAFFLPLGIAQSLVSLSHFIVNSTLARSEWPEATIASYAIAQSIFLLTERPAVLLRQTCSALVRDRQTFGTMIWVMVYTLLGLMAFGALLSFTPAGGFLFLHVFGTEPSLLEPVLSTYRVLMFISVFSAIRCLFQGILISNMRTKWLTIGMIIRLFAMGLVALAFLHSGAAIDGRTGAYIFMVGMAIEALVSFLEGRVVLRRHMPLRDREQPAPSSSDIFRFYRPLVLSSLLAVLVVPAVNLMMGKSLRIELALASFAVAQSVSLLIVGFFAYVHQIVLNFFRAAPGTVYRFCSMLCLIPTAALGLFSFTPIGPWVLSRIMGVEGELLAASIQALRFYAVVTLAFPWIDFCNGLLMLRKQTRVMVWSQGANVLLTVSVSALCVAVAPALNGLIGVFGLSAGMAAELLVALLLIRLSAKAAPLAGREPGERPMRA